MDRTVKECKEIKCDKLKYTRGIYHCANVTYDWQPEEVQNDIRNKCPLKHKDETK